jgi:glycosyltransferase involved in cell wall biosynthesis
MDQNIGAPSVTVFIACYNSSLYIEKAIKSILAQTFEDFELLIIDDGSTDDTLALIKRYKDKRIRILLNGENKGIAYTRQKGLHAAKGKYIAILDSDDIAFPDRIQRQVDQMMKDPDLAICGSQAILKQNGIESLMSTKVGDDKIAMHLVFGNIFINSTVMLNRKFAIDVGGYKLPLAEDYDLAIRLSENHHVLNLPDTLACYNYHEQNISILKQKELEEAEKTILKYLQTTLATSFDIEVHHALLKGNYDQFAIKEYQELLSQLKRGNRIKKRFNEQEFNRLIFNKWFDILYHKKSKKTLFLYLSNDLYEAAFFNFKQFRRALKITLKSLIR